MLLRRSLGSSGLGRCRGDRLTLWRCTFAGDFGAAPFAIDFGSAPFAGDFGPAPAVGDPFLGLFLGVAIAGLFIVDCAAILAKRILSVTLELQVAAKIKI